jgi:Mn2+/Fe2+ NRAMP family transporter
VKARLRIKIIAALRRISVWGPGLLVMLADTDTGNVVTAAQAGAQWGYRLLPRGAAALVWFVPDLVWLNIAAQVLNAFLLPLVIGFLVALAARAPPEPLRLRGFYLWVLIGISAIVIAMGLFGGDHRCTRDHGMPRLR